MTLLNRQMLDTSENNDRGFIIHLSMVTNHRTLREGEIKIYATVSSLTAELSSMVLFL
jgi:hypothetical protein